MDERTVCMRGVEVLKKSPRTTGKVQIVKVAIRQPRIHRNSIISHGSTLTSDSSTGMSTVSRNTALGAREGLRVVLPITHYLAMGWADGINGVIKEAMIHI